MPLLARQKLISLAMGTCLVLAGCEQNIPTDQNNDASAKTKPNEGYIAFVSAGANNPMWPIIKTGAERYRKRIGALDFRYLSPKGHSPQDQIDLLESLQDPKMRGLCIHIIDVDAIRYLLQQLYTRGVVVVSIINPAPENIRSAHVGFDDEKIGEALALTTIEVLNDNGTIMVLHAGSDHPIYGPRLKAFENSLAFHHNIDVFAKINCKADPGRSRDIIRRRSKRFPRLSAWVSLHDWPIKNKREIESIIPLGCKFITFGGTPEQWPLVRNGTSPGIVAANYRFIGYRAAYFCETEVLHDSRFKNSYAAPLRIIRPTNLEEYIRDWGYWATGKYTSDETTPIQQPITVDEYNLNP